MSTSRDQAAANFVAEPEAWGEPQGRLAGSDAADHGRVILEAAGVDVEAIERRAGRPRIGGDTRPKGERSTRLR